MECHARPAYELYLKFDPDGNCYLPQFEKVKLNNKKYCWLYPPSWQKKLKKIEPNFEHCETLYTQCDYELEKCTQEVIIKIEQQLRSHQALVKVEIKNQDGIIDQIWVLAQKLAVLNSGCCIETYPEIVAHPEKYRLKCEFRNLYHELYSSNYRMAESIHAAKLYLKELNRLYGLLDWTLKSPFLVGSWYQRPLPVVRQQITDLYESYHKHLCTLQSWAMLIDEEESCTIEDYIALIKSSQPNKFLVSFMDDCKCKRTNNPDVLREQQPC